MNPEAAPEAVPESVEAEQSDAQKIAGLLELFKARRAVDGKEDPLNDERVLAAALEEAQREHERFTKFQNPGGVDERRDLAA